MTLPTIHLNGTSAKSLYEGYAEARNAVEQAILKLEAIEFNGRDYYPQGPAAYTKAHAEHIERAVVLRKVSDDLLEIADHIYKYIKD